MSNIEKSKEELLQELQELRKENEILKTVNQNAIALQNQTNNGLNDFGVKNIDIVNSSLIYQNQEKEKRAAELIIANKELIYQNQEKEMRAAELIIANEELIYQNQEKEKRAAELIIANEELIYQNQEKEKRAAELIIANKELIYQNQEKEKRAAELIIANEELIYQNQEKEKRAAELIIANKELEYRDVEKEKRAEELLIANKELVFQDKEKNQRAAELLIANVELDYQTEEKEKRAAELLIANLELDYQTVEKEKRAAELIIANVELDYQTEEKEKRAAELVIANKELIFQNQEKEKRAEELTIANKELEYQDELKERTKQLIEANAELVKAKSSAEKANKAKSTFLANMSHEIRTPMNAVLGFSELLSELVTDPKAKNYLKAIQTSGKALHTLINDILDITKIEAGMFEINNEIIDIKQVISEIKYIFSLKFQEKGLELIIDFAEKLPSQIYLDELRVKQVIMNLVGNAFKFTDFGYVKITVSYLPDSELQGTLSISVEDTGIGIPLESQDKIFNVFQQQEMQDTRKYGGTGLGLSISSKLTSLMNGKIELESKPEHGSKFTVIFKDVNKCLDKRIDKETENAIVEDIEFMPSKILIVDDRQSNRDLIKGYFDEFNFNIIEADNGLSAITLTEKEMPDIILMDIRMPIMDGYEASRKIKHNELLTHIPIVVLTASYLESEKSLSMKNFISGYLIKPVSKANLIKELKKHLKYKISQNVETDKQLNKHNDTQTYQIDSLVLERLNNEIMMEWSALQTRKPQEKLKSFSNKLIDIGIENNLTKIEEYGKELLDSANLFDIAHINTKLREFPKLIENYI